MNKADRKLAAAKAVRELLRVITGGRRVYNNIYKTGTRTVKTYQRDVDFSIYEDRITDLAEVFDLDIKFNYTRGSAWSGPAFIVKFI